MLPTRGPEKNILRGAIKRSSQNWSSQNCSNQNCSNFSKEKNPQKGFENKHNEKNKWLFIAKHNYEKLHIFKKLISSTAAIFLWKKHLNSEVNYLKSKR